MISEIDACLDIYEVRDFCLPMTGLQQTRPTRSPALPATLQNVALQQDTAMGRLLFGEFSFTLENFP